MQVSGGFYEAERRERQSPHTPPFRGGWCVGMPADSGSSPTGDDSREQKAEWVRKNFPVVSAFAAAVRAEFGAARLTYASESGQTIGKPMEPAAFAVSGDDLFCHAVRKAKS